MIASSWASLHAQCRALGLRLLLGVVPEVTPGRAAQSRLGLARVVDRHGQAIAAVDVARVGGSLDAAACGLAPVVEDWRRGAGRGAA